MSLKSARARTLSIQMVHNGLEGAVYGFMIMAEVIMRREMRASPLIIAVFTMLGSATNLFSIYFSHILIKYPGKIKRIILVAALVTRLPLALFFIFRGPLALLILTGLYYLGDAFIKPVQNIYMKMNYAKTELGKIFAYSISVNKIIFIIAVYAFGRWMDTDSSIYIVIYSIAGLISFTSFYMLSFIPVDEWVHEKMPDEKVNLLIFPTLVNVFRKNRRFLIYEIAFFIYGGGAMVVLPAVPILLVDCLNLPYSVISFGRGVLSAIVIVIAIPLMGRIFDRNPVFVGVLSFFILIFHPLAMMSSYFVPESFAKWFVYFAYIIFGVGMSAVTLCWNIGPMYFAANNREIPEMTSVHVTLTGIRGLIWPVLGYFLMKIHIIVPFIAAALFFCVAVLIMRTILDKPVSQS